MKNPDVNAGAGSTLRAGDWVEVLSADEILATLDERGCLDALPFMPEMLPFCGKTFRVFKAAHKTCDTIENYKGRRMASAVHLEGLRCDGADHGGCQAGCLLFWKEAWLRRVNGPQVQEKRAAVFSPAQSDRASASASHCDIASLARATHAPAGDGQEAADRYACQATELLKATTPFQWWEPGSYLKDLTSRNVRLDVLVIHMMIAALNVVLRLHWRGRPNAYPYIRGLAPRGQKTPTEELNLKAGDLVQVRSRQEIRRTLDANRRNRGLSFDVEMVRYCGGTFRVLRRVEKLIDEKTGKMIYPPGVCLILDGATCVGCLSRDRLFCPRSIYPYWREIWLRRVE